MTAQEVAGECDIPRSTAYRKVELLEEAGLVSDEIRVQANGGHPVTYQRVFETVDVVITGGGPRVSLTRRESGDGRRADDH